MKLIARFAKAVITRAQRRPPDFVVSNASDGTVYLRRWWVLPRNPLLNVYLHQFVSSDDDRALHDHPWASLSLALRGCYVEVLPLSQRQQPAWDYMSGHTRYALRCAGEWRYRPAGLRHRIEVSAAGAWTLFITGPVYREWGFHCRTGWVPWAHFVSSADKGAVGAGCEGAVRAPRRFWRRWRATDA